MKTVARAALIAVPFVSMLTACGGGGDGGSGSNSGTTGNGTLQVSMTDAPSCGFDHVFVTVNKVRVNTSSSAGDNDAGWTDITMASPRRSTCSR